MLTWYAKKADKQDGVWFVEFHYNKEITPRYYRFEVSENKGDDVMEVGELKIYY